MVRTPEEVLGDIFNGFSAQTLVEKPCVVSKVIDQYTVDITYYDNNIPNTLVNVPVKHFQTNSAYIFLGIKEGDCGTVRFFDNDVNAYYESSEVASDEERTHNLNDNLFTYGFYPSSKQYIFPDGDVVIGTVAGAVINITEKEIKINAETIVIENEATIDVTSDSDITVTGKSKLNVTTTSDITVNSSANINVTGTSNVNVTGTSSVSISGATVTIGQATTIDNVNFLNHTHYDLGNSSPLTGRVIV